MRAAFRISHLWLRQNARHLPRSHWGYLEPGWKRTYGGGAKGYFRSYPRRRGVILTAATGLSPALFFALSETDNGGTEQTAEGRMLEASREEIRKKVSEDDRGFTRFRKEVVLFLDMYIWEPICTALRFLHLVVIFVPVIATVPAIWIGPRVKERQNERTGTLWWYGFLINSMERAGPAFIKVTCLSLLVE